MGHPEFVWATRHLVNPQTLNRYAFSVNNPLRFVDPDGRDVVDIGGYLQAQFVQVSGEIGRFDWAAAIGGRALLQEKGVIVGKYNKTIRL